MEGKMKIHNDHQHVKILRPDAKGRIHLGALAQGVSGYKITVNEETHAITLDPYAEVPLAEKWLFENPEALKSIKRGLQDSKEGKLVDRGSFSKYINKEK